MQRLGAGACYFGIGIGIGIGFGIRTDGFGKASGGALFAQFQQLFGQLALAVPAGFQLLQFGAGIAERSAVAGQRAFSAVEQAPTPRLERPLVADSY